MTAVAVARFARQRAGQIRQGMRDYLKTLALIKEAWDQRDWEALGYHDWQTYVDGEFGADRLGLSAEHRQKAVAELRMAGMSNRAIGAALGVSHPTVINDLRSGGQDLPPAKVTGSDGKQYPATMPQRQEIADAITKGIDEAIANKPEPPVAPPDEAGGSIPDRPRPPKWDPAERAAHEEDVRRMKDVEAARRYAKTLVTDVRALVLTIVEGYRLGETHLVTRQDIADLRRTIDLLEGELGDEE